MSDLWQFRADCACGENLTAALRTDRAARIAAAIWHLRHRKCSRRRAKGDE